MKKAQKFIEANSEPVTVKSFNFDTFHIEHDNDVYGLYPGLNDTVYIRWVACPEDFDRLLISAIDDATHYLKELVKLQKIYSKEFLEGDSE